MPIPNQTALVTEVKQDCLTRGIIPQPQTSNRDSFQITGRVAWRLRDKGAKLVLKNAAQNGYTLEDGPYAGARVSHDAIAFSDGWADCLTNAGPPANGNGPTWQWTATGPPAPGTVIDPYDLDATAPTPGPDPNPTPGESLDALVVAVDELTAIVTAQSELLGALKQEVAALALDVQANTDVTDKISAVQDRGLSGRLGLNLVLMPNAPPKANGLG